LDDDFIATEALGTSRKWNLVWYGYNTAETAKIIELFFQEILAAKVNICLRTLGFKYNNSPYS